MLRDVVHSIQSRLEPHGLLRPEEGEVVRRWPKIDVTSTRKRMMKPVSGEKARPGLNRRVFVDDKRLLPLFGAEFIALRKSEKTWHHCKYCHKTCRRLSSLNCVPSVMFLRGGLHQDLRLFRWITPCVATNK